MENDEEIVLDRPLKTDDIIAACSSLGTTDASDGLYMKDRDCKACLKEIIRDLNNDNKSHVIRSTLASLNIVKSDLIPLMNQYCDFNEGDPDLFNLVLRLLINLTSSVLLLFQNQEVPDDPESAKIVNTLIKGIAKYKQAFAHDITIWETLNTHLRHTEDEIPFERLLVLIRNILHIPVDSTDEFGFHDSFDAHDMCLHWIGKSGMLQTLIDIASETQRGTEFCFHIMEIVYLMLRDKNPQTIAKASLNTNKRKLADDDVDKKKLAELRARDRASKSAIQSRPIAVRRGATFAIQNVRSISEAPQITRRLPARGEKIEFDLGKTELKKNRNRKPFDPDKSSTVLSDLDTRPSKVSYELKVFCKQFTEKVYANYMQQIKHNLIQKKAAENDESYYLWAVQFFTAFNRHMHLKIDNISETFSTSTLHFIQILINDYQDKLKIEKKRNKIEQISKRLHLAIRAYREILILIQSNEAGSDFGSLVDQIKKKIFSEVEYSGMLLTLFQQYDESKYCREYLKDLLSANEVFLNIGTTTQSMSMYFHPDVVRAYACVMKNFRTNSAETNLAISHYFERLAYDNHMEVMLMQASIFVILLEIIDEGHVAGYERFLKLAKSLMSKFLTMVAGDKKRWMFQELLFWKSHGDVLEIEHDPQKEQVITAETVDDAEPGVDVNHEFIAPDGEEEDVVMDQGGLSPLSQISGVDDVDDNHSDSNSSFGSMSPLPDLASDEIPTNGLSAAQLAQDALNSPKEDSSSDDSLAEILRSPTPDGIDHFEEATQGVKRRMILESDEDESGDEICKVSQESSLVPENSDNNQNSCDQTAPIVLEANTNSSDRVESNTNELGSSSPRSDSG